MPIRYTASNLNTAGTFYLPTRTTNADMEEVETLTEVHRLRGEFLPSPGRERMRAEQIDAEPRAMFVMRYRSWVTTNHVVDIRGEIYEIHSIVDVDGRRRYLELILTKRRFQ